MKRFNFEYRCLTKLFFMKRLSLFLAMLVSSLAFSQSNIEDVVYLKSGSVIRGKITPPNPLKGELNTTDKVNVELLGGSAWRISFASDISAISSRLRWLGNERNNFL